MIVEMVCSPESVGSCLSKDHPKESFVWNLLSARRQENSVACILLSISYFLSLTKLLLYASAIWFKEVDQCLRNS